jgi:hypothetical protein
MLCSLLALGLAPQHYGIDQRLRLEARNVAQRRYELVEARVHAGTAYQFYPGLRLAAVGHALGDFLVGLEVELQNFISSAGPLSRRTHGIEEVVQRVLAHRLQLVLRLVP